MILMNFVLQFPLQSSIKYQNVDIFFDFLRTTNNRSCTKLLSIQLRSKNVINITTYRKNLKHF